MHRHCDLQDSGDDDVGFYINPNDEESNELDRLARVSAEDIYRCASLVAVARPLARQALRRSAAASTTSARVAISSTGLPRVTFRHVTNTYVIGARILLCRSPFEMPIMYLMSGNPDGHQNSVWLS